MLLNSITFQLLCFILISILILDASDSKMLIDVNNMSVIADTNQLWYNSVSSA